MLREQNQVEWTLFNIGWLADYFIPKELTYIKPAPRDFPIDANDYWAIVRGTGDERQSWTCARDVARAVVELCKASEWVSGIAIFSKHRLKMITEAFCFLGWVSSHVDYSLIMFFRRVTHTWPPNGAHSTPQSRPWNPSTVLTHRPSLLTPYFSA